VLIQPYDPRNIRTGYEIPSEGYCDQPYVVVNDDGSWTCVMTTGPGHEGAAGQHVVTTRSEDQGKTWSTPVDVEPSDGPEASYAVLLRIPSGRLFCFYNHNTDNVREVIADDPPFTGGKCRRVDSLGYHVFRYSDDCGRSWSAKRFALPIRQMDIDRKNPFGGNIQFFWNVGKPFVHEGAAYISVHKVGGFGEGFFTRSEGVLLRSDNLLTETDPEKVHWETLPEGDFGLRTPPGGGPIAEEQSYAALSDGSFFSVYRTIDGHPAYAYSRDAGRTWSEPRYMQYADGRLMKHPRAANFVWKCSNGKHLYWFHNHGGNGYEDRNPAWLCGGVETDSPEGKVIKWSQPEIVLYDDDPCIRMSYPDLVEQDGKYFLTETQKLTARVHEVDPSLLQGLWSQFESAGEAREGLVLDLPCGDSPIPSEIDAPPLPVFLSHDSFNRAFGTKNLRTGFSLDLRVRFDDLSHGQVLLDNWSETTKGLCLQTTTRGTLEIVLNDGRTESRWDCDPWMLEEGREHHVVINVDGGPSIVTFITDGKLCDGGEHRQFGWGRFNPNLQDVNGGKILRIAPRLNGKLICLRMYGRALRTSEAVGNFRAGRTKGLR